MQNCELRDEDSKQIIMTGRSLYKNLVLQNKYTEGISKTFNDVYTSEKL